MEAFASQPVPAPPFRLRSSGRTITLEPFANELVILAFFDGHGGQDDNGEPGDTAERERAAAELRALGASLLTVSASGLWCFRPDEESRLFAPAATLDANDVEGARAAFGVPPGAAAVFLLEPGTENGGPVIRFAHVVAGDAGDEATFATVVDALAMAGRDVVSRRDQFTFTRRQLVASSVIAAFSLAFLDGCRSRPAASPPPATANPAAAEIEIKLDVNGTPRTLRVDTRVTLLDALRERLELRGTKKGCDQGQCGACTVLVDGRRVNACLTLAVAAQGVPITTIEGLSSDGTLNPLQAAFITEDAFQCGYCTSGQIVSAMGLLREQQASATLSDDDIREHMSGNICRCGAYPNIVAAIQRARPLLHGREG